MIAGKHGVTENTPKNIPFGAGTIHRGLKYTAGSGGSGGSWNKAESLVGATTGGSKLSIIPEITNIDVDGVLVKAKGLAAKTGETASIEINFSELTKDIIKAATFGAEGTSADATNFDVIESKSNIATGDYWENIAFVGKTLENEEIIAILDNALCTSGFELEGKNKEASVLKCTFECYADLDGELDKLPWRIYYPNRTA